MLHHTEELSDAVEDNPEDEELLYSVDMVRKALGSLPDGFRAVVSLYLMEGYDHHEIAEIMGISENTSKSQYKRGKEKLKELIIGMSNG